jgi:hypothetical protein
VTAVRRYMSHRSISHIFSNHLDTQSICGKSTLWGLGVWLEDDEHKHEVCRNCVDLLRRQQPINPKGK